MTSWTPWGGWDGVPPTNLPANAFAHQSVNLSAYSLLTFGEGVCLFVKVSPYMGATSFYGGTPLISSDGTSVFVFWTVLVLRSQCLTVQ
jgi:hypothetical protein